MRHLFLLLLPLAACSSNADQPSAPGDAGANESAADAIGADAAPEAGGACSAALADLLRPATKVSTGLVSVLSDTGGVKTIYVDASAGGAQIAESNPRVYVSLETGARVDISDVDAAGSTAWDLALKRSVLFTNDGDGGPGQGGAVLVSKAFDAVTSADATSASFATESFIDAECNAKADAVGDVVTTFTGWYDYNEQQHTLTPHAGTYLVKGGGGKVYKVAIGSYYATPDGGVSTDGGHFTLRVAPL